MLIYVDDLLITGNDNSMIEDLQVTLHQNFKMKNLGTLKYFLGIEISRSKEGIIMNQWKYALELIADLGLLDAKPAHTPLEQNLKLTSLEYDAALDIHDTSTELTDASVYQRLIGRLLYLTNTRPDIAFGVQHLSQFMHKPKWEHYEAALRIVRYLKKSSGQSIFLSSEGTTDIQAYCDSDWASCPMTRKSVTGYCVKLGNSLVSWKSKKQTTVSRSSAEAEYRSMATTVAELVWLKGLLAELGFHVSKPMLLHCDNQAALQIASNPVFHERTKHIDIDCHFVREKIQTGDVVTHHISTNEQVADLLTKGLGISQHQYLVSKLGLKDIFHPPT
ncbi:uncharacterized mitochondrial protein AtMg00810-like [Gossypium raimondii]|uniref:uncharacterized mitochondrial protein AtMg00810-like n=1 Tax=Gossypium raimondii TaxID=29730 RepID=UPI00227BDC31|nr:uncharacterized mitochondrial protein AtMg00810-like [Gossypium raimondii]